MTTGAENKSIEDGKKNGENIRTMLRLLKNFPGDDVYALLTDYFFHPDNEVSKTAVQSSAVNGNVEAVGHLFTIIKKGPPACKMEAIRALAEIRAPGTVEHLVQYFTTFKETDLKREILDAVRGIQPNHERVIELNRGVLSDSSEREDLHRSAVQELIDAGDFTFLDYYISNAAPSIQETAFQHIVTSDDETVSSFLKKLEGRLQTISESARASFLCACILKEKNPSLPFILEMLSGSTKNILLKFLTLLRSNIRQCVSVKSIFRFLVMVPFVDREVEAVVGDLIRATIEVFRKRSPHALNELRTVVSVHLDTSFKKAQIGLTSIKKISNRDELLPLFLRHCLEKYCPAAVVEDMRTLFKKAITEDAKLLIEKLTWFISEGTNSDIKGFRACMPLFLEGDHKRRYRIYTVMRNADPQISTLLRRLTRLIKAAGFLGMKGSLKKFRDVYEFAHEQQVLYLEKAAIVTLCQLGSKYIMRKSEQVFEKPSVEREYLKSFIRGAQYLPASLAADQLIGLLFLPDIVPEERSLDIEVLSSMNLKGNEAAVRRLFRIFETDYFEPEEREKAADIIAAYGGSDSFRTAVGYLDSRDPEMKRTGIEIIRKKGKIDGDVSRDVVIGKLYSLIENGLRSVKVDALAALLMLRDDYVEKVACDWLSSSDTALVLDVLHALSGVFRRSHLKPVFQHLRSDNPEIREAAYELLSAQAESPMAEEVKAAVVDELITVPFWERASSGVKGLVAGPEETFLHPKLELQLKREYSQNLTVFFIDMVGYTEKTERSDITKLMLLVKQFDETVIPAVETYNGQIIKKMGDGILAVFKHPVNAAISALEIQGKIREYNLYAVEEEKFSVRIGIHSGSVLWRENDIYGDVVNTASRLEGAAFPDEILITDTVYAEVRDFINCKPRGEISVKGKEDAISAYIPRGVVKDVKALLEIRNSNIDSLITVRDSGSIEHLKKALFNPRFFIPAGMEHVAEIADMVQSLFRELSAASSEISHDFHEEYLFKRYLQDKWNETIAKLRGLGR